MKNMLMIDGVALCPVEPMTAETLKGLAQSKGPGALVNRPMIAMARSDGDSLGIWRVLDMPVKKIADDAIYDTSVNIRFNHGGDGDGS